MSTNTKTSVTIISNKSEEHLAIRYHLNAISTKGTFLEINVRVTIYEGALQLIILNICSKILNFTVYSIESQCRLNSIGVI